MREREFGVSYVHHVYCTHYSCILFVCLCVLQFLSTEDADDVRCAESAGGLQDCPPRPAETKVCVCVYLCVCVCVNVCVCTDTNGAEESVLYREVSSFQGFKCMQEWSLGWEKVSFLERCPQFRGVLIEGFHCIYMCVCVSYFPPLSVQRDG